MTRLVVVSNRVPRPDGQANTGGLATALNAALDEQGGIWFGWSSRTVDMPDPKAEVTCAGNFTLATIDLSETELDGYYDRLANQALWPAFHGRLDLVRVDHDAYATYRRVNRRFAESLHGHLCGDDTIWVHDYHLVPLGRELRRLGVASPIGFFLHIPFPPPEVFAALPWARELVQSLAAYDLIGFQTQGCVRNFLEYARRYALGATKESGWVRVEGHEARVEAHPIGIDTRSFADLAASPAATAGAARMRKGLAGRIGAAGVERLDYSKGLAQRFHAFERLLERFPEYLSEVTLFQVAAPSRLGVPEYRSMQSELDALSGRINGRFGSINWDPIHYLNRPISHVQVAALFRACRVGLVTPLRDGMNLVAKEYVAAQDPADPGALVLSCFAGAAQELSEAIIVNPYDADAMAQALRNAFEMPLAERLERWQAMMRRLETNDVHRWRLGFLNALEWTRASGRLCSAA